MLRIDLQAYLLAIDVFGQSGVAVAGEAVVVRGLLRTKSRYCKEKNAGDECDSAELSNRS